MFSSMAVVPVCKIDLGSCYQNYFQRGNQVWLLNERKENLQWEKVWERGKQAVGNHIIGKGAVDSPIF